MTNTERIDKLNREKQLTREDWITLIQTYNDTDREYAAAIARELTTAQFGDKIYIRGIVEFSNFCKNDCLYCGIRHSNKNADRYRLTQEDILACCDEGYGYGFRTFVLQSGEDPWYTDDRLAAIVSAIKAAHPDCAVTLSLGERSRESYQRLYDAGADRYLLRHETANEAHYHKLHPAELSLAHRMACLRDLKAIGYQTGCGFMVGSPYQTAECLAEDMLFIKELQPEMIGIGALHPPQGHALPGRAPGLLRADLIFAQPVPDHAAQGSAASHHRPGHHRSDGPGKGGAGRSQRGHAQSVAIGCAQKNTYSTTTRSVPATNPPSASSAWGPG